MENFIICVVFTIKINPPEFLDVKFFDNEIYETKLFVNHSNYKIPGKLKSQNDKSNLKNFFDL